MRATLRQGFCRLGILSTAIAWNTLVLAQPPAAESPQARIALGLGQSDNLNRDSEEIRSDITRLEVGFAASTDRRRIRGGIAGDLQLLKYGADEISDDSETLGSVDGQLAFHLVPDRFYWDIDYSYGQVRIDPTAAVGPANRQRTVVAATGPVLVLPLGDRNSLEMGLRVSDRSYDATASLDSRLSTFRMSLARMLDQVTRVAVILEQSENEFDADPETYEFEIASLEYSRELASGQAIASVGRGRIKIGDTSRPTTVARLAWDRAVGSRSRLEVCATRELTDAGGLFAGGGGAVGCQGQLSGLTEVTTRTDGRLQGVVLSRSPLRHEGLGARFDMRNDLANVTFAIGTTRDRFETDTSFDNDLTTLQLSGWRELGRRWRAEASIRRWDQQFLESGIDNEDQSIRIAVSRVLARNTRLELSLERNRRVSDQDPFDENVVFLSLARNFGRQ